jgi:aminopeptidase N
MLAEHLGHDTFIGGVSDYLKAHAYGNATTDDLWRALTKASGQDINALMDPWIRKIGYPVLTVTEEEGQISVKQTRYLSTGDVEPEEDQTTWWVPLGLKGTSGVEVGGIALTEKQDTVQDVDNTFYKLNTDNTGFYRTNYPPARLAKLGKQIEKLTISDKIGLIGDAGALALSGAGNTPALLAFVEGFSAEENYLVWSQITSSLGTIKSIFSEDIEITEGLKSFTLKLIGDAVSKIGWDFKDGEDYLTGQLRALLISSAGLNGNKE